MRNSFERAPQPESPVKEAQQAVMTAEEYAQTEHGRPYVYEAEAGDKKVTYFAPGHSWDPSNPVWSQLKQKFEEANPDIVLVEGFDNLEERRQQVIEAASKYGEEEVIGRMAESGLALKLAAERGIDFSSPEPKFSDEIAHLEQQGLSRNAIFAYYIFRMVPQWQQHQTKDDFREYIQREIENIRRATQWDGFDYTYENAERIAQQFWGESINLDEPEYYADVDPIPWEEKKDQQTEVNLVARASSRFRDQYVIGQIAEHLKTHDRLFIVYGASHAVMQEPAIKKLMEENK